MVANKKELPESPDVFQTIARLFCDYYPMSKYQGKSAARPDGIIPGWFSETGG